jgi:hypothetical protein
MLDVRLAAFHERPIPKILWIEHIRSWSRTRSTGTPRRSSERGIDLLLKREDEQPSGWTAGRPRMG